MFTATFSVRMGANGRAGRSTAALTLREVRALQPGWLAVQMVEAYARFWYSSWPEACAAAKDEWLCGQALRRRLSGCCGCAALSA